MGRVRRTGGIISWALVDALQLLDSIVTARRVPQHLISPLPVWQQEGRPEKVADLATRYIRIYIRRKENLDKRGREIFHQWAGEDL